MNGLAERVALSLVAAAVVHARCVVVGVDGRWTVTAIAWRANRDKQKATRVQGEDNSVKSPVGFSVICNHTPVQADVFLHVALMASWHRVPSFSNMQFRQHGLFRSLKREGTQKNDYLPTSRQGRP